MKMKIRHVLTFLFVVFFAISSYSQDSVVKPVSERITFLHNGVAREYILYKPNNLKDNAPLVFMLHGHKSSAEKIRAYSGMNPIADKNGFAVCYPQGLVDENGFSYWNAELINLPADDIGFLSELAKFIQKEYRLSTKNTFVCGMSNGGFMSYTLACAKPDVFKAIGSVCGTMSGITWNNRNKSKPIPILQIHGTADKVVPIDGSMAIPGGWGGAPAMDSIIVFWAARDNCTTTDSTFFPQNTKAYYHRNGTNGNEVWYYKIDGWGHVWPGALSKDPNRVNNTGTNASSVLWTFFSRFLK